jgi:hypothetical protein
MSKNVSQIAKRIYTETIEKQGVSVNMDGLIPVKGYMVGLYSCEKKINILEFTVNDVEKYILNHADFLFNPIYFVGTWINNDVVYMDISTNIMHKDQALKCAKIELQICIWDVEKKVEIYQLEEV